MRLTQTRLKALLSYGPETGVFTWFIAPNGRIRVGMAAGNLNPNGYVHIKVDGILYKAHRLAWLYMTGAWPTEEQIDHINGVRSDNRWANLRECERKINAQNRRKPHPLNKSSGLLGVSRRNPTGGYQARIRVNGKEKPLGTYATAEAAHQAYVAAKRALHPGCTI